MMLAIVIVRVKVMGTYDCKYQSSTSREFPWLEIEAIKECFSDYELVSSRQPNQVDDYERPNRGSVFQKMKVKSVRTTWMTGAEDGLLFKVERERVCVCVKRMGRRQRSKTKVTSTFYMHREQAFLALALRQRICSLSTGHR